MKTVFFGGAFDPFHSQHRALIETVLKEGKADRVVVYPSFLPPHKSKLQSPFEARLRMVQKGTEDLGRVFVDRIEQERNKVNYSYEVIPLLKAKYPSDEYGFLMGEDSLLHFGNWVRPDLIARQIKLIVGARGEAGNLDRIIQSVEQKFNAQIEVLEFCGKPVSSSEIKARTELGLTQEDIIPEVEKIIKENNLYKQFPEIVEKVRNTIPAKTFDHVCRTVLFALKLNTYLNIPYEKVFLATFLHDCTKHLNVKMEGVPDAVVHQYTGCTEAEEIYGVKDKDVLSAIRCHTTGKPNMSKLDKLVYCSDLLEMGRDFPGVAKLRKVIENDFEAGFLACLKNCYEHVIFSGKPFDPLTKECALYYNII